MADFNDTIFNTQKYGDDLTFTLRELQDDAYIFISANLLKYIGDAFKDWEICWTSTESGIITKYKLTDKGKCLFTAY